MEDVPVIQKMIIEKVYNAGKQVITGDADAGLHDEPSQTHQSRDDGRGERRI